MKIIRSSAKKGMPNKRGFHHCRSCGWTWFSTVDVTVDVRFVLTAN